MKKVLVVVGMALYLVGLAHSAFASSSTEEAKALVEKAAAYFQANGKENALKEFNNAKGEFFKGELYVFVYDLTGTVLAQPANPKQVGINVIDVPDVDGKYFRKEGIELAKKNGTAWVDYKFRNPKTNKIEQKTSYLKKVGDFVIGCGAYK